MRLQDVQYADLNPQEMKMMESLNRVRLASNPTANPRDILATMGMSSPSDLLSALGSGLSAQSSAHGPAPPSPMAGSAASTVAMEPPPRAKRQQRPFLEIDPQGINPEELYIIPGSPEMLTRSGTTLTFEIVPGTSVIGMINARNPRLQPTDSHPHRAEAPILSVLYLATVCGTQTAEIVDLMSKVQQLQAGLGATIEGCFNLMIQEINQKEKEGYTIIPGIEVIRKLQSEMPRWIAPPVYSMETPRPAVPQFTG